MASNGKHHQAFLYRMEKVEKGNSIWNCIRPNAEWDSHSLDEGVAHQATRVREERDDNQINVPKDPCDFLRSIQEGNTAHGAHGDGDAWTMKSVVNGS